MSDQKMGFEGQALYGVAGSTAGTLIPETRDMSYTFDVERGDTTARAADGSIPIETDQVTGRKWQFDMQTLNVPGNAVIAALLAASFAGTPVALRTKDFSAGKGYDGDCNVTHKLSKSLKGEQVIDFTFKPTRAAGRTPQLYV